MVTVGVYGSPHKDGQSAYVVNGILEKMGNSEISKFYLDEMLIHPCKGCLGCKKNGGGCVQSDDMQAVYRAIDKADVLVIGTPIYMWQMTGQTKTFTDRLMPYFRNGEKSGKKLILVFTWKSSSPEAYIEYTKKMYEHLGFDVIGTIALGNVYAEPVETRKDLGEKIREIVGSL
jgi:Multimeric flavodoxin WrbA